MKKNLLYIRKTLYDEKETPVKLIGVLLVLVGWLLPVLTLVSVQSTGARLFLSLLGIAISLATDLPVIIAAGGIENMTALGRFIG